MTSNFENRYSVVERALHQVAFNTCNFQVALSAFEDRWFSKRIIEIGIHKPVFITALPRAGTTLLLELLAGLDEFASHRYRDMPFILIPMLWNYYSTKFQQKSTPQLRAHNDGMFVDIDSPEAFEEVVWKTFWVQQYIDDKIIPWDDIANPEFDFFLRNHIRKIIALRNSTIASEVRYISKNNLNIARLNVLQRIFPDSKIIIPFRNPLQHAVSLLRQHTNFLEIHGNDKFAQDYMAAIGHYDFGMNLRPIDFAGWLATAEYTNPQTLPFWVEYWAAAYKYMLDRSNDGVYFLSYENLCQRPKRGLECLAEIIEIIKRDDLINKASRMRVLKPSSIGTIDISPPLLEKVENLYDDLMKVSIN